MTKAGQKRDDLSGEEGSALTLAGPVAERCTHRFEAEIKRREANKHEDRRADQTTHQGEAERLPERIAERQRKQTDDGGDRRRDQRAETRGDRCLDCFASRRAGTALLVRRIDEQDRVVDRDPDQGDEPHAGEERLRIVGQFEDPEDPEEAQRDRQEDQ